MNKEVWNANTEQKQQENCMDSIQKEGFLGGMGLEASGYCFHLLITVSDEKREEVLTSVKKHVNENYIHAVSAKELSFSLQAVAKRSDSSHVQSDAGNHLRVQPLHYLFITDQVALAQQALAKGMACLFYLHEKNREESLSGIRYVIEGFKDADASYFSYVYCRLHHLPVRILETKRCVIRESVMEDVDAFYEIYKDPSITRYMENLYRDPCEERAYLGEYIRCVYEFMDVGIWTVLDKKCGKVIGRAGLDVHDGTDCLELGFVFDRKYQNQGICQEVCRAILVYAFEERQVEKVEAYVDKENAVSVHILKKLGFVWEGKEGKLERYGCKSVRV